MLEDNPYTELNLLRAMVLRRKYNMQYSERLCNIIARYAMNQDCVQKLMRIQKNRYGYTVLDEKAVEEEIANSL